MNIELFNHANSRASLITNHENIANISIQIQATANMIAHTASSERRNIIQNQLSQISKQIGKSQNVSVQISGIREHEVWQHDWREARIDRIKAIKEKAQPYPRPKEKDEGPTIKRAPDKGSIEIGSRNISQREIKLKEVRIQEGDRVRIIKIHEF